MLLSVQSHCTDVSMEPPTVGTEVEFMFPKHSGSDVGDKTRWSGRVVDASGIVLDGTPTFVVNVKADREALPVGRECLMTIKVKYNPVVAKRQIVAIQRISECAKGTPLERFILGSDLHLAESMESLARKSAPDHELMEELQKVWRHAGLNAHQLQGMLAPLAGDRLVSLLLGPPGTGKTATTNIEIISASMLGLKTLATAPSNAAAQQLFLGLVKARAKLPEHLQKLVRLSYFPTMATTKEHLHDPEDLVWEVTGAVDQVD
jgi:hypothetical protein